MTLSWKTYLVKDEWDWLWLIHSVTKQYAMSKVFETSHVKVVEAREVTTQDRETLDDKIRAAERMKNVAIYVSGAWPT